MPDGDELLRLALARPAEAVAAADRVLAGRPDPRTASIARQTRAIVFRDAGRYVEAVRELRRALRLADTSGDRERRIDVQATLGATLVTSGRTTTGLATLDAAVAESAGHLAGRVLLRRGHQLVTLGRPAAALADLSRAVRLLHRAGDALWEARALNNRFDVYAMTGQTARAHRDLERAEHLFRRIGQDLEAAMAVHGHAEIALHAGDVPAALRHLDEAADRYDALGYFAPDLVFDRSRTLLAAGLADEASQEADAGVERLAGRSAARAELLFAAARAAQAAGRPPDAAVRATAARDLFRAQHRDWWAARAEFVLVQARYDAGRRDGRVRAAAARIADRLAELGAEEAPAAHLLAGRMAAAAGRTAEADRHLARAARSRRQGPTFGHAAGWLAQALRAEARGSTAAALHACRRGLLAAADHQRRLGAVELRVHAARYGVELAAIGQRHAVRRGDARMLLAWSERWRASALASPYARSAEDAELAADLAALRGVMSRLDTARAARAPTDGLERERRRLEQAVRSRTRRAGSPAPRAAARTVTEAALDRLGEHLLVELVALDDLLYAITARRGRTRLHAVGPVANAIREVDLARFMLRRLARGRPPPGSLERLAIAGDRLQAALLGRAASDIGSRPVVIAPPGPLHAVPWAMLPALHGVPWSVVPSAATWVQADQRARPRRRRTVVVVGPDLPGTLAEAGRIADQYPSPVVLSHGAATAVRVLAALDGAAVAHIATHGVFRADNPLFSALQMHDGPLTGYDLSRLRRSPHRLVLSSCESGVSAPAAGDELLGLISVLVPLGTASLLASVVPVNDAATGPLMVAFHAALRAGAAFPEALRDARAATSGDPVGVATGLAFVALGR
ncbi:CHAT domain-containing protein [Jidongwangia harbinensis]|uniref:CHAT domain-containing protein n=1 Tax=Jidongwangia harbinensis TaxID=2878561 RepID=UPI001CD9799A|nr:CHAT domain-containing protein [Jidongwangia harbinensis]MCA2213195.1 CHAT domain-containing protein [Jidongwangia harbinensis]